ncbi:MAG: S1 family peptidase [Candidatus Electronema sp. VV]
MEQAEKGAGDGGTVVDEQGFLDRIEEMKIPFAVHFESIKVIDKHLVPILSAINDHFFQFKGTGVYIRKGMRHFLVTANHVVKTNEPDRILLPTDIDSFSSIQVRASIATRDENADIALFEMLQPLTHFSPIDYKDICDLTDDACAIYMIGFPASRVSLDKRKPIEFEQRIILTKKVDNGTQHFEHFDERTNFVCDFKKKALNGNGKIVTFPDPYGMSGGGVFEPSYSKTNVLSGYTLVGIMTEWNPRKKRYIRCTKASLLRFMIDHLCSTP